MGIYTVRRRESGFTMLEMAVVLVVIAMILGMVSLGKDLHRNAQYTKIYANFIQQWVLAYDTYLDRTGVVLADNQATPTLRVNASGTMLCEPAVNPPALSLFQVVNAAGVQMPNGRAAGSEDHFAYLDSNGNPQDIRICFQSLAWFEADGVTTRNRNVMMITGLTPDLARSLDAIVDGQPDARFGNFRQFPALAGVAQLPWTANNTLAFGGGAALDEGQIITTSAIYRMVR
ncbi:MAG: prepilin-type N-terminal cleavage/methylation domain-containing protein [Mariprofundaceae bacterium]